MNQQKFLIVVDMQNDFIDGSLGTKEAQAIMPAVTERIRALKSEGYGLAVVSNCQTGYVKAFLASSGAADLFIDYEEWGRTGLTKGENIRLVMERNGYTKGIYIGDTKKDQEATLQAGLPFIHAAYGFGKAENPDGIINALSELPATVSQLVK